MAATLEVRILGPFEVRVDGGAPAALGGLRQRALLAVLCLHANQVISTDQLVDELWGEVPPATAVHTVQVFASRLRAALVPAAERLVTRPPGRSVRVADTASIAPVGAIAGALTRKTATILVARLTAMRHADPEVTRRAVAAARERSGYIGKIYIFKIMGGIQPRIACLAPGSSQPGQGC